MGNKKKKKVQFFYSFSFKLFLTFSLIIIMGFYLLTFFIMKKVSIQMVQQETKLTNEIVKDISEYIEQRISAARKTIRDVYYADDELQKTIYRMLIKNEEEDYLLNYISNKKKFDRLFISALYNDSDITDIIVIN